MPLASPLMEDKTPIEQVVDALFYEKNLSPEERAATLRALKSNFIVNYGLLTRLNPEKFVRLDLPPHITSVLKNAVVDSPQEKLPTPFKTSGGAKKDLKSSHPSVTNPLKSSGSPRTSKPGEIPPGYYRAPIIFNKAPEPELSDDDVDDSDSSSDSLDDLLATWGFPKPKKDPSVPSQGSSKCPWIFSLMMQERQKQKLAAAPVESEILESSSLNANEEEDSTSSSEDDPIALAPIKDSHKSKSLVPQGHSSISGLSGAELEEAKAQCPHFAFQAKAKVASQ